MKAKIIKMPDTGETVTLRLWGKVIVIRRDEFDEEGTYRFNAFGEDYEVQLVEDKQEPQEYTTTTEESNDAEEETSPTEPRPKRKKGK